MAIRHIRCMIEQIADWHSSLYLEPHIVAFVAVANKYSPSPAIFDVECVNITSRWLGAAAKFRLEVLWHGDTAVNAERLRATMQSGPLVELGSVALALVLAKRVAQLGRLVGTRVSLFVPSAQGDTEYA